MSKRTRMIFKCISNSILILIYVGGFLSFVFLAGFRGYIVPSEHGPVLQVPFLAEEDSTTAVSGNISITVDGKEGRSLNGILLSTEDIDDGTAQEKIEVGDANAFALPLRIDNGTLNFVSDVPLAIEAKASHSFPARNNAIQELCMHSSLYSIALFSCFPDKLVSSYYPDSTLQRLQGVSFRDENNTPWLSMDDERMQDYLLDLCQEIKALGFDEIILEDFLYPNEGRNGQTYVPSETCNASLAQFYDRLCKIAKEEKLHISILLPQEPVDDLAFPNLLLSCHRVWIEGTMQDAETLFSHYNLSYARAGKLQTTGNLLAFFIS